MGTKDFFSVKALLPLLPYGNTARFDPPGGCFHLQTPSLPGLHMNNMLVQFCGGRCLDPGS
ncbi:hypothetical protein DAEQUDRAFT_727921 [Daedalea quercina L-15889]|uniref:Uncharacterized protein n=1 Tax=Daedalea quercina L-15889 TaxID=1314783 RepID=A0A165PLF0_9APHY|nr:hypothetical protein DAEQUDRAFT_727921 [Daedalea quercina L-15889]